MNVEFWSTFFAAPKPLNMNQVVDLRCNYPPSPSVKKTIGFYYPPPRDHKLRLPPRTARPLARDASPPPGIPPRHRSPPPHRRCPFLCCLSPPSPPSDPILTWATSSPTEHVFMSLESDPSLEPSLPFVGPHPHCNSSSPPVNATPPPIRAAVKLRRASSPERGHEQRRSVPVAVLQVRRPPNHHNGTPFPRWMCYI
jgi:hypothetical protein